MDWKDILFLLVIICGAVFILYRTVKNKKWCPDIYGSGSCGIDKKDGKKKRPSNNPDR